MPHVSWAAIGLAAALVAVVGVARSGTPRPGGTGAPGPRARRVGPLGGLPTRAGGAGAGRRPGSTVAGGRRGARWATRSEIRPLVVGGVAGDRLPLGALARRWGGPGRTRLAAEPAQSVAVVGPTQSGKTTALAVPAILSWDGPVLAASVKTDLVRDTIGWRGRRGRVWCFDPGRATGLPASRWSPLPAASTWAGARRVAADLTEVTRGPGTTPDGEFWYATAAKLLAPLLFAASHAGLDMHDVVRWVDTQEVGEVADILAATGVPEALQAARATWQRDDRQRSSVYTTAETVLEPYAEPDAGPGRWGGETGAGPGGAGVHGVDPGPVDTTALLHGANTLYLCAPAHDQRRLRGLFTAVVKQVLEAAFEQAARHGGRLAVPLLVVLDEAANIAPLAELDGLAATCAGHGVQLVTVWQDLAQVTARYGDRALTVVNNHRAKVFLSGTSDPRTLDHASHLIGDEEVTMPSVTRDPSGARSVTSSSVQRRLLPPEELRRLPASAGVLVYGSLPPVRLALRPWFDDPVLSARARPSTGAWPLSPSRSGARDPAPAGTRPPDPGGSPPVRSTA